MINENLNKLWTKSTPYFKLENRNTKWDNRVIYIWPSQNPDFRYIPENLRLGKEKTKTNSFNLILISLNKKSCLRNKDRLRSTISKLKKKRKTKII